MKTAVSLGAAVLCALTISAQSAATPYEVIDLGTFGGWYSQARHVNNSGQIAGASQVVPGGAWHAFLWEADTGMRSLDAFPDLRSSTAYAVNGPGNAIGTVLFPATFHAFLWDEVGGTLFAFCQNRTGG